MALTSALVLSLLHFFIIDTKGDNWKKSLEQYLLLLLSFLLIAEVIYIYVFPQYLIKDPYVLKKNYYFNKPFYKQKFIDKEYSTHYITNSQGFRIGESNDPGVRIENADFIFIGDSFTQGAQVEFDELFTSRVYENFSNKIILNAGISGFNLIDEYYFYKDEGYKYQPEIVFLQLCNFNDFYNVIKKKRSITELLMHYSNFIRLMLYSVKYSHPNTLPLGRWTEPFYEDIRSNINFNIFYEKTSEQKDKDIENFKKYLKLFNDEVRKNGSKLVVLLVPTKEQIYSKFYDEVVSNFKIDITKLDMQKPNKLVQSLAKELNFDLIDLYQPFLKNPNQLFFDYDEHLNKKGHQEVAKQVKHFLSNQGYQTKVERISILNANDRYPQQSVDGKQTSWQSYRDGSLEIFLGDSEFKNVKRLVSNHTDEIHPTLSPDKKKILFTQGDQEKHQTKVCLIDRNGQNKIVITSENDEYGSIPSFSPDGKKIAYAQWFYKKNKITKPKIVIYDLEKKSKTLVTSDDKEYWRPVFSPDGKSLAYIAKPKGKNFDVFTHKLASNEVKNITNSIFDDWDPNFSPNGKYLAYASNRDGNWDLFITSLNKNKTVRLTNTDGNEWDPAFSSDGKEIYYGAVYGLFNGIYNLPIPQNIKS